MPTRRTRRTHALAAHRVTIEAVEAWRRGDMQALHAALGLRPWMPSPLPLAVEGLGVDPRRPPAPGDGTVWAQSWPLAVELQGELMRLAGAPGRADE